ncbi:MAG: hypothetical protein ABSH12_02330, partial [Endomicrobiales bacterium]
MRNNIASVCLIILSFAVISAGATVVSVNGKKLLVNGTPFTIKGVCYSPTPVGYYPTTFDWWDVQSIYQNDFALLKSMGVNTIRTYNTTGITTAFLDAAAKNGIYVIMGYEVNHSSVGITADGAAMVND